MTGRRTQTRAILLSMIMVLSVIAMGTAGLVGTAAAEDTDTIFVTGDPDDDGFETIQGAIDNADGGDTIKVEDGEYEEALDIDVEGLTLEAADDAEPTVSYEPDSVSGSATVDIEASDVEISGLTVERIAHEDREAESNHAQGIVIRDDGATIDGVEIEGDLGAVTHDDDYDRFDGLVVLDTGGDNDDIHVEDVDISGFHAGFVVSEFDGTGVDGVTFEQSTVTDNNDGIVIKSHHGEDHVTDVTVEELTIAQNEGHGIWAGPVGYQGYDLNELDIDPSEGGLNIVDSHLSESKFGVTADGVGEATIENSQFEEIDLIGIELGLEEATIRNNDLKPAEEATVFIDGSEVTLEENEIASFEFGSSVVVNTPDLLKVTDNTLTDGAEGLRLNMIDEDDTDIIVEENTFRENEYGFVFSTGPGSEPDAQQISGESDTVNVEATENEFVDNTEFGVQNYIQDVTIDAEKNWWGAENGPSGEGDGDGDAVNKSVDFEPFYIDADRETLSDDDAEQPVFNTDQQVGFESIQQALNDAEEGDTIEVDDGEYDRVVVSQKGDGFDVDAEDLTIEAVGDAIISYDEDNGQAAVTVQQDGTTIDGFSVERDGGEGNIGQGIDVTASDVTVTDTQVESNVDNNDIGIYVTDRLLNPDGGTLGTIDNGVTGVEITETMVTGFASGVSVITSDDGGETIESVEVTDSTIKSNDAGLKFAEVDGSADLGKVYVSEGNDISNNDIGVSILGDDEIDGIDFQDPSVEDVEITDNTISGNDDGLQNGAERTLDATENWWGTEDGPSVEHDEAGDSVSGEVDFEPFYIDADRETLSDDGDDEGPGIKHSEGTAGAFGITTQDGDRFVTEGLSASPENEETMTFGGDADRSIEIRDANSEKALEIIPDSETTYDDVEFIELDIVGGDGEIEDPDIFLQGPRERIDVDTEGDEDIFTSQEDTFTEFELALLEDSEEIATSEEQLIGIAYEGSLEQDGTADEATITYTRDEEVDEDWYVEFVLGDNREVVTEVDNDDSADEFEVEVDLSDIDDGEYTAGFDLYEDEDDEIGERIIGLFDVDAVQVGDDEPVDPDVSIDHNPGSSTASTPIDDDTRAYTDQLDIFVDTDDPVEFGGDADKELRVVDPETDEAVTYTPTGDARTVPLDEINRLGVPNEGDGEPVDEIWPFPDVDSELSSENMDATVEGDTGIYTDETFNEYVIELVDGDGNVLDSTDERLVGMGYEATFDQDGETATVTRDDAVDEDWTVTFKVTGDDEDLPPREQIIDEIELENTDDDDEFEVPIDELDVEPGEYRWGLVIVDEDRADSDRERIVRVSGSPDTDDGLTIPEPVTIENLEIVESGDTVNDEVTVTADVEDAEAVELGLSAEFTSFTTTAEATETETDEFEATIDASDVESVGDGEFNAFIIASDETGAEVTDENEDQQVTFDTSTPDVSLSLVDLGSDEATAELDSDEDIRITEATIEANGDDVETDPDDGFSDERTVEFDGEPLSEEDETTFDVTIDVEDEAGNENTETAEATISGFDVEDGEDGLEANVETSLDSNFVLNPDGESAGDGSDGDLSASETDSNPTDDELAEELLGAQFINISAISIDDTEIDTDADLEGATITVDLTEVGIDGVDDADLELAGVEDDEFTPDADAIIEQEVVGDELIATVSGFSTYGVTAPDEDPEITETDVDPAEPDEDDDSVTATFEYEANPNPEDSPIDTSETGVDIEIDGDTVDGDDGRVDVQTTNDETTVTIDSLEANEEIEFDLTVVDDNGNDASETKTVTVDEVEEEDDDDDDDTSSTGGGGGGATPTDDDTDDDGAVDDDDVVDDEDDDDDVVDDEDDVVDDDDDEVEDVDDETPGFGAIVALVALIGAALLAVRRQN